MPNENRQQDPDVDELSTQLNEGLKTCRSVVENYRAMLRGERREHSATDEFEQDNYPDPPETA